MLYADMAQQRSLHFLVGTQEVDRIALQLHLHLLVRLIKQILQAGDATFIFGFLCWMVIRSDGTTICWSSSARQVLTHGSCILSIRRGDRVAYACHLLHIAVDANLDPDYKF